MSRTDRPSASDRCPSPGAERRAVWAAAAFAVSQPIFDLVARAPEFLWLRGITGLRLWGFTFGVFLAPPVLMILLAEIARRIRPGFGLALYRLWLGLGLAFLTLVVLRQVTPDLAATVAFAAAAGLALLGVRIHARRRWARELGNGLSLLVWIFPVLFLARPGVHADRRSIELEDVPAPASAPPPIVLVIWDELPVATLMTPTGEIDADWFPGFARLASTSTWFRDTVTTSTLTLQAVPAVLTGRTVEGMEEGGGLTDPRTVFRLLEASHQFQAYSAVAGIVPDVIPMLGGADEEVLDGPLRDLRTLYLHLSMPRGIRDRLPQVSAAWGDFETHRDEGPRLRRAIDAIELPPNTERPTFLYLQSLLPHHPWMYLPSGARYWNADHVVAPGLSGIAGIGRWGADPWPVIQAYQRHVLQSMYADRLLTALIDHLEEIGLWESALVVVTSDHGAFFAPGEPLRIPTETTVAEVAAVPLFIKLPGQHEPGVDDRRASGLDILPTLADAYGQEVPWDLEGVSLLREDRLPERRRAVRHSEAGVLEVTRGLVDEIRAVAKARRRVFGRPSADAAPDPMLIGPYSSLVGRRLSEVEIVVSGDPWSAERVEQDSSDGTIPARLKFLIDGLDAFHRPTAFALAIGEEFVATTAAFPGAEPSFSVLIPEEAALRIGDGLRLFRVLADGQGPPKLEEISLSHTTYRLSGDGAWVLGGDGERWKIEPGAFRGEVRRLDIPSTQDVTQVLAWAVDDAERAPRRLVVFSGDRSIAWARSGAPKGDFLDYIRFTMPEERIFYTVFPRSDSSRPDAPPRYFVLGADGRAGELPASADP